MTGDDARLANKLELERKLDLDDIVPGMPEDQAIERALARLEHNQQVNRQHKLWEKLALTLDGDTELSLYLTADREVSIPFSDKTVNGVIIASRGVLSADISRCPILHTDAYVDESIVRVFLPRLDLHEVAVKWPPMTTVSVTQALDRVISKSATSDLVLEEARRLIELEAAAAGGRPVGVITLMHIEKALRAAARPLPPNVRLAHYGAITGLNDMSDVYTLLLIGRPEAAPYTLEKQARLLWRREVESVESYYPKRQRAAAVRHGSPVTVEGGYYHPDPSVEALRFGASEGELSQATYRGRPLNRRPANPLKIVLATNVVLPFEIDLVTDWDGLQPTALELMLARGGVAPVGYADMAACYPDLFPTEKAARNRAARERENPAQFPIVYPFRELGGVSRRRYIFARPAGCYRELGGVFLVHYRRVGSRGPAGAAFYDHDRIPDPLLWLQERLGDVVLVEAQGT